PHQDAGSRTEPPMSEPRLTGAYPTAAATAAPELEPPGLQARFQGLRAGGCSEDRLDESIPSSGITVRASTGAPAARSRSTTGEFDVAGTGVVAADPHGVGRPTTDWFSLRVTGTPSR